MAHATRLTVAAILLGLAATGCSSGGGAPSGASDRHRLSGTVVVLAASSLTDSFTAIAAAFEAANPDVRVDLTFDGSAKLATEIIEGVPADVYVSADEASLLRVTRAGGTQGSSAVIATNELQIVVPRGNPRRIGDLADLVDGVVLALCRPEVPCGAYAARAFQRAGIEVPRAGEEDSVRAVLTKVQLGEADAGIVYRTDVLAAHGVTGVDLAEADQVRATYPASVLADAPNPGAGAAFLVFLLGDEAQAILARAGFGRP